MKNTKDIGNNGEDRAVAYLFSQGYTLCERNWRSSHKEVDIIAQDAEYLVFFEVKTRKSFHALHPVEVFSQRQQKNIIACAYMYTYEHGLSDIPLRFDLLCVLASTGQVMHWKNVITL